jgi:CheY-like chemotaxis protein
MMFVLSTMTMSVHAPGRSINLDMSLAAFRPFAYRSRGAAKNVSARRLLPDIILLDIQMPGMDRYETTSNLSGDKATRIVPVVMVTVLSGAEDRIKV